MTTCGITFSDCTLQRGRSVEVPGAGAGRRRRVGETAEQEREGEKCDEEAGHELPAGRRLLWIRFMLSGMNSPFSSRRKRNTVVSCPSKVSSTFDCSTCCTCPC